MSQNVYVTEIARAVEQRRFVGGKTSDLLSAPVVRCTVLSPNGSPAGVLASSHEIVIALTAEEHAKLTKLMADIGERVTLLLSSKEQE